MQSKKTQIPISLKVSYKDQLQLKLSIPQKFQIEKFTRHWVIIGGFYQFQQQQMSKRYFSYLNEGDLIKIKGNFVKTNWKQKTERKLQTIIDSQGKSLHLLKATKMNETTLIREINQKKILQKLTKFYHQDLANQMDGLKVITLFLKLDSDNSFILKILDLIKSQNNSNTLVNIFLNDQIMLQDPNYNFIDKWVSFHSVMNFESELRYCFFRLNKITVKKITFNLTCFDGQLSRRDTFRRKEKHSQWGLENNILAFELNFPQCNKVYINTIQFRNVGYQQCYKFQLSLNCVDINDICFRSTKTFQLKPQRSEFESIRSPDYHAENQKKLKQVLNIQQSLKFDSVEIFDKLQNLKQICQKIQIQIKNNGNFDTSKDEEDDKLKMMHSFEI